MLSMKYMQVIQTGLLLTTVTLSLSGCSNQKIEPKCSTKPLTYQTVKGMPPRAITTKTDDDNQTIQSNYLFDEADADISNGIKADNGAYLNQQIRQSEITGKVAEYNRKNKY